MTDWNPLIVAAAALLLACATALPGFLAYLGTRSNNKQAVTLNTKADVQAEKTDVIHDAVNGGRTAILADLAAAQLRIHSLERLVVELNTRIATLTPAATPAP